MAARAGFDSQLTKRAYESSSLNPVNHRIDLDHLNDDSFSRRIEDRRYDESFRNCLDFDSINRRYENDHILKRYECNNSDTLRSIQNDLKKFDCSLNYNLRSDRSEKSENENLENRRRLDNSSLLTTEGINLSDTLSRKLSNYDNTRMIDEETLTRRISDDVSDISCNSLGGRGNQ